jgi:hypothetical protein
MAYGMVYRDKSLYGISGTQQFEPVRPDLQIPDCFYALVIVGKMTPDILVSHTPAKYPKPPAPLRLMAAEKAIGAALTVCLRQIATTLHV